MKTKPQVIDVFSVNGELSHWALIDPETGVKLWSEDPEECKAMGHPVKSSDLKELKDWDEASKMFEKEYKYYEELNYTYVFDFLKEKYRFPVQRAEENY